MKNTRKCPGTGQPVAIKIFAGGKVIGVCGACNRIHPTLNMSKTGNVSPLHYLGTATFSNGVTQS